MLHRHLSFLTPPPLVAAVPFLFQKPDSSFLPTSSPPPEAPPHVVVKRPRAVLFSDKPSTSSPPTPTPTPTPAPKPRHSSAPIRRSSSVVVKRRPTPSFSSSAQRQPHVQIESLPHLEELRLLACASGALGRGVRATLRAFYRRANFVLPRRANIQQQPSQRQRNRNRNKANTRNWKDDELFYVEIGPAYVLSVARLGAEHVTRYAVEQRAWPRLRTLLRWDEASTTDARARGAPLRKLRMGVRYGRHIFLSYDALATMLTVAEELLSDVNVTDDPQQKQISSSTTGSSTSSVSDILNVQIEAVIHLKRRPIAGVRTVAAQCPRGHTAHRNGDRNPSLLLWMNDDGVTGGAMCPVCLEQSSLSSSSPTQEQQEQQQQHDSVVPPSRHLTWRVHYIQGNTAVLCTPHRRIQSPPHVTRAMHQLQTHYSAQTKAQRKLENGPQKRSRSTKQQQHQQRQQQRNELSSFSATNSALSDATDTGNAMIPDGTYSAEMISKILDNTDIEESFNSILSRSDASPTSSGQSASLSCSSISLKSGGEPLDDDDEIGDVPAISASPSKRKARTRSASTPPNSLLASSSTLPSESTPVEQARKKSTSPVGDYVLRNKKTLAQIGKSSSLAYVTASLKIARDENTAWINPSDGTKLRTIGTKARLGCPMQVLLWSDRRSKGPRSARRVEDVAWYARQSIMDSEDDSDTDYDDDGDVDDDVDDDDSDSVSSSRLSESSQGTESTSAGGSPMNGHSASLAEAVESEQWLPTAVVSVSAMRASVWREVLNANGQLVSVPAAWEPAAQAWVLFDLDDLDDLRANIVPTVASKITLAIRRNPELSGRCLVLHTGPRGLHVWAELREVRYNPRAWFKHPDTRAWYAHCGQKLLSAAHRAGASNGTVDPCSCSAGRFARRPGWRLLEDGTAFRSGVVTYVPSRVKGRLPR